MTPRSAKLHACKSHHAREFDDIDLPLNEEVLKTLMDEVRAPVRHTRRGRGHSIIAMTAG